ncbi:MAG: hypothetical protein U1F49_13645 [Rubrivivax sp.]
MSPSKRSLRRSTPRPALLAALVLGALAQWAEPARADSAVGVDTPSATH